ncbi:calcium-binding protein [Methylobacterium sp. 10]|uniref:calcium-binding protein n=1 Tax=Methylobacterium sp. 10 TaxID=1101191 RepID=UPI0006848BEC|nr:calcium-binding protein [Methylobacterium sp. 10]
MASVSFTVDDDYDSTKTVRLDGNPLASYAGPASSHAFGPDGQGRFILNDTGTIADGGSTFTDAARTVPGGYAALTSDRYAVFLDMFDNTASLSLTGGTFGDVLRGGSGDDVLTGGGGNDVFEGGEGDNVIKGGTGSDTVSYEHAQYSIEVYLEDSRAYTAPTGDEDTLSSIANVRGTRFGDVLTGDGRANRIEGGAGEDVIGGGGGNDALDGGAGNDSINGGGGDDLIEGGAGTDVIRGGGGIDTASYEHSSSGVTIDLFRTYQVSGGDANEDMLYDITNVTGSLYGDRLAGNGKDNTLDGSGGADRLYGNNGNDRLIVSATPVEVDGGAGRDVLIVEVNPNLDTLRFSDETFSAIEKVAVRSDGSIDMRDVTLGTSIISQSVAGDHGKIIGTAGDDRIRAGSGGDRIDAWSGDNTVLGGVGKDQFIFRSEKGRTEIHDFELGRDKLNVVPLTTNFDDVVITSVHGGDDTLVTFAKYTGIEHRIILHDVAASSLGEGDFII